MIPKVMAFVGANNAKSISRQKEKIKRIYSMDKPPEILSDVSVYFSDVPLWRYILEETNFIVATVPLYKTAFYNKKITPNLILKDILTCAESGVKLITIHPTPDSRLVELSRKRRVPTTSRGGAIVVNQCIVKAGIGNQYTYILDEIADIAKQYNVTISIGSTFRGANIFDGFDKANREEILKQAKIAQYFIAKGVHAIIEGPGHIEIKKIRKFSQIVNKYRLNVMPLGPIIVENNNSVDEIIATIGVVLLAKFVNIENIASITAREHAGGVPTLYETMQGIRSSQVAVQIIKQMKYGLLEEDLECVSLREKNKSCITSGVCSRCGSFCPLKTC